MRDELQIFVDAGYHVATPAGIHSKAKEEEKAALNQAGLSQAGLGVWIPALGTGVSLEAAAKDNNEAETLAILLGIVIGRLMNLTNTVVVTDSKLNADRLASEAPCTGVLHIAQRALVAGNVQLDWRPREETALADFFASLALAGKSFVGKTANGKNPADKFRPLLHAERKDKAPIKDVAVKWLKLPAQPKAAPDLQANGIAQFAPGIGSLLGSRLPTSEFLLLAEEFKARARKLG